MPYVPENAATLLPSRIEEMFAASDPAYDLDEGVPDIECNIFRIDRRTAG